MSWDTEPEPHTPWFAREGDSIRPIVGGLGGQILVSSKNILQVNSPNTVLQITDDISLHTLQQNNSLWPAGTPGTGSGSPTWSYKSVSIGDVLLYRFASKQPLTVNFPAVLIHVSDIVINAQTLIDPHASVSDGLGVRIYPVYVDWDPTAITFNTATFLNSSWPDSIPYCSADIINPDVVGVQASPNSPGSTVTTWTYANSSDGSREYWYALQTARDGGMLDLDAGLAPTTTTIKVNSNGLPTSRFLGQSINFVTGTLAGVTGVTITGVTDNGDGTFTLTFGAQSVVPTASGLVAITQDLYGVAIVLETSTWQNDQTAPVAPYYGLGTFKLNKDPEFFPQIPLFGFGG